MKLWILRHGEAEPHARSDAQRNLTEHGREQVRQAAAHLIGQSIDTMLVSPYVRAQQTAEIVRKVLGGTPALKTVSWLTPESDPACAVGQLPDNGNVLLVSHQPFVGELISLLQYGHYRSPEPMQTASLAQLEGDGALAGCMHLRTVRHP
jgi:phosphohistidine phosphatase